ncbi:sulfide/dihydroorotate dehydrogenase-like FAD/NAD-binding protein [Clostridium aestuarii]|uniref:Sulfide/dihydroorotate dehydrogenase-like FAD/NAD-binding protein n=1 Tax=Clostridium aestuarii TaxID=338193 RepID=A0ABT4D2T8_9CLOT|nr:sulfide/dihydroorotate dehydrogenase-like FAD/NAD-binding protein [Clostridium aestuarii]MCY6484358.1 sulfide/dihydroorotate dehydrogenase-like FAD/NAD-binding protein [Clostridium aestuarii]
MFKIIKKKVLVPNIYLMDVEAPRVASTAMPGQFVIVKTDEKGERVPLTICDYDRERGTVTIVFQAVGYSTIEMAKYEEGQYFQDFVGPLGKPSEFLNEDIQELKNKKVLFISGGVGAAPVYPQVKWFHDNGMKSDVIMGVRTKELLILEDEMRAVADNVYVTTDDGSYGTKGLVTEKFKELVENQGKKYDYVVAIGPIIMMKYAALTTKPYGIKTIVSMNPLMVDGTGMCGACRVTIGNETKFACVDGPEFDGHLVDFDEAMRRQAMYKTEEGREKLKMEEPNQDKHHHHHGGCGCCGGEE